MTEANDYLANCIHRILLADCSSTEEYRRCCDLAGAIRVANELGPNAAHRRLIELVNLAEAGEYRAAKAEAAAHAKTGEAAGGRKR